MRYIISESQAVFIKKKFHFGKLLGLNENQHVKFSTESFLREKGIIYLLNGKDELKTEYRALMSFWGKMRYSVVRPELNSRERFQCILSNETACMIVARKKDIMTIDVFDFSEERMDGMLKAFAEIQDANASDSKFIINMTVEEYNKFIAITKTNEFEDWSKKLGLTPETIGTFLVKVNTPQKGQMLLVEDHIGDCGYLLKMVNSDTGIYAIKHVTHGNLQKMVLIHGDSQYVTDSIYTF